MPQIKRPEHFADALLSSQHVHTTCIAAKETVHHFGLGVAVDTFVEPGILKLISGHHSVPVLMAELVLGYVFRFVAVAFGRPPACATGDEGWVLHASRFISPVWRINNRKLRIGIRPIPFVEA